MRLHAQDTTASAKPAPVVGVPAMSPAASPDSAKSRGTPSASASVAPSLPNSAATGSISGTPGSTIRVTKDAGTTAPAPAPRAAATAAVATASTGTPGVPSPGVAKPSTPAPVTVPSAAEIPANELANAFVQRAVSLYEQGKDEAAIVEYKKGLASDATDSDTWYGLAELYRELGRMRQAVETYSTALTTIEHAPELRVPFAQLLMSLHRKTEAIKVLQRGIELDPDASDEMKAVLGNVVLGVLDENGNPKADADTARGTAAPAKGASGRSRTKVDRKKRKKLCKLFCAGAFDPVAPKPK